MAIGLGNNGIPKPPAVDRPRIGRERLQAAVASANARPASESLQSTLILRASFFDYLKLNVRYGSFRTFHTLLLNNAGIGGPRGQTIGNIDYETWARVLDINTLGPMRVAEAFVDNVERSDRKLIVTITSGAIGDNSSGGAFAYRTSKAAVNMVMRSLAIDLASRGITCAVINPGWVRTGMGGPPA